MCQTLLCQIFTMMWFTTSVKKTPKCKTLYTAFSFLSHRSERSSRSMSRAEFYLHPLKPALVETYNLLLVKSGINVKHNSISPTCWVAVTVQACNFTADSKQDWEFRVKISSEILSYKVMKVDQESKSNESPNKLKTAVWLSLSLI